MDPLIIAHGKSDLVILPQMANRHGMIAGAIGRQIIRGILGGILGSKRG